MRSVWCFGIAIGHTKQNAPDSHPNSEVKLLQARVVLGWGTTREGRVLIAFLHFCIFAPCFGSPSPPHTDHHIPSLWAWCGYCGHDAVGLDGGRQGMLWSGSLSTVLECPQALLDVELEPMCVFGSGGTVGRMGRGSAVKYAGRRVLWCGVVCVYV